MTAALKPMPFRFLRAAYQMAVDTVRDNSADDRKIDGDHPVLTVRDYWPSCIELVRDDVRTGAPWTLGLAGAAIGSRIRVKREVDRYPFFVVPKGATGTLVTNEDNLIAVRLDETIVEAEDWDNELHWSPELFGDVAGDIEVV